MLPNVGIFEISKRKPNLSFPHFNASIKLSEVGDESSHANNEKIGVCGSNTNDEDKLVSWFILRSGGDLGSAHTLKNYRGLGLAILSGKNITSLVRSHSHTCYSIIVGERRIQDHFSESCGFRKVARAKYVIYSPREVKVENIIAAIERD